MALLSPEARPLSASPSATKEAAAPTPARSKKVRRGPFRPPMLTPVRSRLYGPSLARLFKGLDAAAIAAAVLGVAWAEAAGGFLSLTLEQTLPLFLGGVAALAMLRLALAYNLGPRETAGRHLLRVGLAATTGALAALTAAALTGPAGLPAALGFLVLAPPVLGLTHAFAWIAVRRWRAQGRLTPNIIVVGATRNAQRLIEACLKTREANLIGIFDDRADRVPASIHGVPVLGDTRVLLDHRVMPYVDRIVITVTSSAQARVRALIERLQVLPNAITLFVDVEGEDSRKAVLARLADAPLAQVSGVAEDERRAFYKRMQDLVLGGLALVAAAPIMLAVAIAVRLDSPGPIFFRQRRHGFNNETIVVWKFRSMRQEDSDPSATRQVVADDERITRVGRFIRKTSLDELPQLINVLSGEMSLVGPRPHPIGMIAAGQEAARLVSEYAWRHRIKPGITGWAQINGSRGPVHTADDVRRRVVLDIDYIERQSFLFDLHILAMTLPRLLGDRGAVR